MNPWLILGPSGMIAVGLASIALWQRRSRTALGYPLLGGTVWCVSIAPKLVMDYTVTPRLSSLLMSSLGLAGGLAALGVYVGLRTGLFECGFTYLAIDRTSLREASADEATAFGVGFGATEAVILALPSLVQLVSFMVNPALIDALPPGYREALLAQLDAPTWIVAAPVLERAFTLFAHLFTALLIFAAVRRKRIRLFLCAFAYKSVLDAVVPYLQWALASSASPATVYLAEVWVVLMGSIGIIGSIRLRRGWA
ncbi:hypothetical protein AC482_03430 [miscellaneous Crenarchaeota group-15 archaeon DG-45]|uniref:YhfC family intramembrane metalloprotease n=1 Tax=miscellaneous Crenarchaeota group-15 archaeon DG-45 TaxID=1685127 RepID=A0A0M0BQV6_9ARCH|nr:MAG: hypothetical protein AC482_03430 [miscellaneous Crenarchaeota group-15 archaeon DG-45]